MSAARRGPGSLPRVAFVAPSAYPLGGIAAWLEMLLPALDGEGLHAQLLLLDGDLHDAARYLRVHPVPEPAATVRCATGSAEGRVRAVAGALQALRPDLVIAVNAPDAVLAAARVACRPRIAVALHGLEPDLYADLERHAALLDGVIGSNRLACAAAARRTGLDARRIRHAPYGVALPDAAPRPPRRPGTPLQLGYAGRFDTFQKRVQDLGPVLDALLAAGVDARLRIAGAGPEAPRLEALARAHGDRVQLLGALSPRDMPAFHRSCDVLLNPSSWETGPLVVLEAMAAGTPVVSARYLGSGLEGALVDGGNCLLHPVGDSARAARCAAMLCDPARHRQLAHAARLLVAQSFLREHSVAHWGAALRALLELPRRPPAVAPRPCRAGRLDRWLGSAAGETLRRALGRRAAPAADPGDEWPHTHSRVPREHPPHWSMLKALDRSPAPDRRRPGASAPAKEASWTVS